MTIIDVQEWTFSQSTPPVVMCMCGHPKVNHERQSLHNTQDNRCCRTGCVCMSFQPPPVGTCLCGHGKIDHKDTIGPNRAGNHEGPCIECEWDPKVRMLRCQAYKPDKYTWPTLEPTETTGPLRKR